MVFYKGQILHSLGYSMECKTVPITVEFVEYIEHPRFDCVILSEGIKILCNSEDLSTTPMWNELATKR